MRLHRIENPKEERIAARNKLKITVDSPRRRYDNRGHMTGQFDFQEEFDFEGETFRIRPITESDIETLRHWKNENRKFFSFQQTISPHMQKQWYQGYVSNADEVLYLLERSKDNHPVACVGYRKSSLSPQARGAELFNLIGADPSYQGKGLIQRFFAATCKALKEKGFEHIELKVLQSNQMAQEWYLKQGFQEFHHDPQLRYLRYSL